MLSFQWLKTDEEEIGDINKNTDKSLILYAKKIISIVASMNIIKSSQLGVRATQIFGYTNSNVTISCDAYAASSATFHYFIHVVNI